MRESIVHLRPWEKHRVRRGVRKGSTEEGRRRYRVLLALHHEADPRDVSRVEDVSLVTVYRVIRRYRARGVEGLVDGRSRRPAPKSAPRVVEMIAALIGEDPRGLGYERSTWTCELLSKELRRRLRLSMHRSWVHVLLRRVRARWGRACPSVRRLNPRRWRQWARLALRLRRVPQGDVVLFADEVDIDLNPRIGFAWVRWGEQMKVPTPGKNQKRYLAGALNPDTGHVVWVDGRRKNSDLFIALLAAVSSAYRGARRIHLVVDNYIIHFSKSTTRMVAGYGGRLVLHALPAYSPELNPIERLWKQLHDNVTRNHRFSTMTRLMNAVHRFLQRVTFRTSNPIHMKLTA